MGWEGRLIINGGPPQLFEEEGMLESVGPAQREVPVVCATRDFQGAVAETIACLWNCLWQLGHSPVYCQFQSHGYAFVRANTFANLKQAYGKDVIRGFMIDDDILLKASSQASLKFMVDMADKMHWNVVAPYRVRDGWTSIANEKGDLLSVGDLAQMQPFDRIANAGLGFYYGDLPLSYKFHEEGVFGGEDLNFFHENPQLQPRIFDLDLQHLKVYPLTLKTPIPFMARPIVGKPPHIKSAEELGIKAGAVRINE